MNRPLPWPVRAYCGLSRWLLPAELWVEYGRDLNEAFYDLYAEAAAQTDRIGLLARELRCLLVTAWTERRAARLERKDLLALRARPRTSPSPPGFSPRNVKHESPNALIEMFDSVRNDIRFALRTLRKSPVYTLVAVATLALGIGANAAVFSVVNSVLLRPLPYENPEDLVVVWTNFGRDLPQNWISGPEYLEIAEFNTTLDEFAIFTTSSWSMTSAGSEPARVQGAAVSGSFFPMLRNAAAQGRLIDGSDDSNDAHVVVISDSFWKSRLGGRERVVGSRVTLDGEDFEVVGVLPADFRVHHPNIGAPESIGLYAPFQPAFDSEYSTMSRGSHFLLGFGRKQAGVSMERVQADLDAVAEQMRVTGGYNFEGWGLTGYTLHEDLIENVQSGLSILLGAVGFVLLIACLNVANLQLTRASQRGREIALRTALGAGRGRLVRQLLTEAAVLGAAGAAAGIALAYWLIVALERVLPTGLPRAGSIGLDATVLGFAAAATLATIAVFGVLPGVIATRTNLAETMKDAGRTASGSAHGGRVRTLLVMTEVAAALVLLVGAGLMIRSFSTLINANPGYRTDSLLTMRVALPQPKYDSDTAAVFHRELLTRARAVPGVTAAGGISALPLSNFGGSGSTFVESATTEDVTSFGGYSFIEADRRFVTDGYFETMGFELVRGRLFEPRDNSDGALVTIVDESFARRFWGDDDPLGQRVAASFDVDRSGPAPALTNVQWGEVIGVVRHARLRDFASDGREQVYVPIAQSPVFGVHLAVRTSSEPTAVASAITNLVWDLDPDQPVSDVATMTDRVSNAVAPQRFASLLLGAFAGAAVLLAAIGIYGIVSFSVGQRTSEIGVRMALGAQTNRVRAMILREGMWVVAAGLVVGTIAALSLTRFLTGMLYEVAPTDPATYVGVALVLIGVALTACLVPAIRATRIQPVNALRDD